MDDKINMPIDDDLLRNCLLFLLNEKETFDLKGKINNLIANIPNLLKKIEEKNNIKDKETIIKTILKNKELLIDYIKTFDQIKEQVFDNYYYYSDVIQFYTNKYNEILPIFVSKKKQYKELEIHAKELFRDCFYNFHEQYYFLIKSFIEINDYCLDIINKYNIK